MAQYKIYEPNMARLESKLKSVEKKCKQFGCAFKFEKVEEVMEEVTLDNGAKVAAKFVIVDVEGIAKVDGWQFIGTIDHTPKGNIIREIGSGLEIPEIYRTAECKCDHCGVTRHRNETCVLYNEETGEYKQVGKSCLKAFTGRLDAETITRYISFFDSLIKAQEFDTSKSPNKLYYNIRDILLYSVECVKHFGYARKGSYSVPTCERVFYYYKIDRGFTAGFHPDYLKQVKRERENVNFNHDSESNNLLVDNILEFIQNSNASNNYMHTLKVICSDEYVEGTYFNILVSAVVAYNRDVQYKEEEKKKAEERAKEAEANPSRHVGTVGSNIFVTVADFRVLASNDTQWGMSTLYEIKDTEGNIYIWSTSSGLLHTMKDEFEYTLRCKVVEHTEFRGVQQTRVTRCSIFSISDR